MSSKTMRIGTLLKDGGIYVGAINVDGIYRELVIVNWQYFNAKKAAPKAVPLHKAWPWASAKSAYHSIEARSPSDGLTNSQALADCGNVLAQWAIKQHLHLPAIDELELIYRAAKPTQYPNSYAKRDGINLNSIPPGAPYALDGPTRTTISGLMSGPDAFVDDWYWSSTQGYEHPHCAWAQSFGNGQQQEIMKENSLRCCLVKWLNS